MRQRHLLRALSRDAARRVTRSRGIPVHYVPVSAPVCEQHHRRLPCGRCPEVAS